MAYIGKSIESGTFKVLDTSGNTYNGSNTTFSLGTQVGSAAQLLVSHDGVIQKPGTDYSLASGGASITFSTAPASGASIFIVEISGAVGGTITPADNSVGVTQLNLSDGSSGQFIKTDGSGTLSFASVASLAGIDDQTSSNDDQLTITDTAVVINEDSDDVDFRVESNGNANMLFVSGGNDVVGIGAEGDLGTGLHIKTEDTGGTVSGSAEELVIEGTNHNGMTILSGDAKEGTINFGDSGANRRGFYSYDHSADAAFIGTAASIRVKVDSSGRVLINHTTAVTGEGYLQVKGSTNLSAWQVNSNGLVALRFFNASGSGVGGITVNASGTVYATSSDYRLKENEVAISDGIARLKQLKPYRFNFKTDVDKDGNPTEIVDGFFAHEVSSVVPEAISGEKDAMETYTDDNGDEQTRINPQGIDQSKLVPLLTSALQEAITKIETLEARVTTLEG
jgi:hypothetical protein